MKVLVVGGTGPAGSAVTAALLEKGIQVRCMSRYPDKLKLLRSAVEGCVGDLEKPASLEPCFTGVDGVFLITPFSRNETLLGLAAVAAAKKVGIKRLVYLSVPMPPGSNHIPHFLSKVPVEQAIRDSGILYTILRPNNFYQNDYLWCRAAVMSYNVYPQPIGSVGLTRVDVRDLADAAANALTQPGHEEREYPLHGPDVLTGEAVALVFSRHLRRPIYYAGNDLERWSKQAQHMMPEWMVRDLRVMYEFFQQRGLIASAADLAAQDRILGHKPRDYDSFVTEIIPLWKKEMTNDAQSH